MDRVRLPALKALFNAALPKKDLARVLHAFRMTPARCFAFDGERLIGAGRVITDGVTYGLLCDVVVMPEWQGKGVGRNLVRYVVERLPTGISVMLIAAPGAEPFYRSLGFLPATGAFRQRVGDAEAITVEPDEGDRVYMPPLPLRDR